LLRNKIFYLSRDLHFILRCVKLCDRPDADLSFPDAGPELLYRVADRCDRSKTRNYNSSLHLNKKPVLSKTSDLPSPMQVSLNSHGHAAVYIEHLSGDISGSVPCQERRCIGDIFRLAEFSERDLCHSPLFYLIGEYFCHLCINESRCDRVYRDAAACKLSCR